MKNLIINRTEDSITFIVDENLPKPTRHISNCLSIEEIAKDKSSEMDIFGEPRTPEIVAASEGNDLYSIGDDVFFQTLVMAYAEHRPVVISPDMIWTLICQGFSHHINLEPEKYRHMLVEHEGKKTLEIFRYNEAQLTSDDWADIIREFAEQIEDNTKGEIASTLITDFSTTTPTEAIASRITLMSTVKAFFDFSVMQMICGIPHITLQGTAEDWHKILEKSKELSKFDLDWWISKLTPILEQFVKTAEGCPDQTFWKNIVMTWRPEQIRGGGCAPDPEGPTMVDGWFLKFFPYYQEGRTPDEVSAHDSMLDETVSVPVNYRLVNGLGETIKETKMKVTAGLIGVSEDKETYALIPKFGWYIEEEVSEDALFKKLEHEDKYRGISLVIDIVPEVLKRFKHIQYLDLSFVGNVIIPEWLDDIEIDTLVIYGRMTEEEKDDIRKRFPDCIFG